MNIIDLGNLPQIYLESFRFCFCLFTHIVPVYESHFFFFVEIQDIDGDWVVTGTFSVTRGDEEIVRPRYWERSLVYPHNYYPPNHTITCLEYL